MLSKIPNYSEDKSIDIGKYNLEAIKNGKGRIKFTGAYIHLAPICNFRCDGCFTHIGLQRRIKLNFQQIKSIIDFARDRGAKSIIFAGAGEPTLDPDFNRVIGYIKKQNLQVVLFTNMTTLKSKKQAKEFLLLGPVIGKLYTLDEKKFNQITHYKTAFQDATRGLKFLLEAKKELEKTGKEITLAIDSYITKENYMDLSDLLRFCRKNEIIPYFEAFIELGQSKEIIRKLALSEKELSQLFLRLQKIDNDEFGIKTPIHSWSRNYGMDVCKKATHMFSVRENGNVHMCVCSLRRVGNINDQENPYKSLEKIFDVKNKWLLNYFVCDKCSKFINPKHLK